MRCLAVFVLALLIAASPAAATGLEDAQQGVAALRGGKYDEALKLFARAIKSGELNRVDSAVVHNGAGIAYKQLGQYDLALAAYGRAIAVKPDFARAYFNRAALHGERRNFADAVHDYGKAIKLKKRFYQAHGNRAVAYYNLKRYDDAIADYTAAIAIKPHAVLFTGRCMAYERNGQRRKAVVDCRLSLQMRPKGSRALAVLKRLGATP